MKSFLTHWGSDGGCWERHHEYLCYTCELKAVRKRNGQREGGSEGETKKSTGRIIEFVVEELERMQSPVSLLQLWMSCLPRLSWDNWAKCARLCRYTQKVRISPSAAHWLLLTNTPIWRFVTDPNQTTSACKHSECEQDTKGPTLLKTACKMHRPLKLFQEDILLGCQQNSK